MQTLRLALDWTWNTNHAGFWVAQKLGYYEEVGLQLDFLTPNQDQYLETPAKKVELGKADIALCPLESILSYRTKSSPFPLWAIAAIYQHDTSALVTLPTIHSPKELDQKIYASYQAKYEDHIIRKMIQQDGGQGDIRIYYPPKLGIWNTLLEKSADATWIFMPWEGVMAQQRGIPLNYFKLKDYGIPYSYSPVLATSESLIQTSSGIVSSFLKASAKGFAWAKANPGKTAELLLEVVPAEDQDLDFLTESQNQASASYLDPWGKMDMQQIQIFLDWLHQEKLEQQYLAAEMSTNHLFD
ncbi:MAG: ABC transporter substrate-binding protein [Spirosomataceae bacterium]